MQKVWIVIISKCMSFHGFNEDCRIHSATSGEHPQLASPIQSGDLLEMVYISNTISPTRFKWTIVHLKRVGEIVLGIY
jgi:hypothetical protein